MGIRERGAGAAVLAAGVLALMPGAASAGDQEQYLGVSEARAQVRGFLESIEMQSGDEMTARRVWGCRRGSPQRVACRFSEAGRDAQDGRLYRCWGKIRVVKYRASYAHMGYAITCRNL
jgi:hypothetical protein